MSNFNQVEDLVLLDEINAANSTEYTGTHLSIVAVGEDVPAEIDRNSNLDVAAVPGSGLTGTRTFYFNRVDLSTVPGIAEEPAEFFWSQFEDLTDPTVADIIPLLNERYVINLTADVISNSAAVIEQPDVGGENEYTLTVSGSKNWIGSLAVTIKRDEVDLADVLPNTLLSGLNYNKPAGD